MNLIVQLLGFVLTVLGSTLCGIFYRWLLCFVLIGCFFLLAFLYHLASKLLASRYLRQAHFALAVVLRAENNRIYLRRGVELRPGYLGKWIEVRAHLEPGKEEVLQMVDVEQHIERRTEWIVKVIRDRYPSLKE